MAMMLKPSVAAALDPTVTYTAGRLGLAEGTGAAPSIYSLSNNDLGIFFESTDYMRFVINGTKYWAFDSVGTHLHASQSLGWGAAAAGDTQDDIQIARHAAGQMRIVGANVGGLVIKIATTTVTAAAGATVTAAGVIPARAQVIGVSTRVNTALGTGSGTTGYSVGDGTDADRWGTVVGTAAGTDTDSSTDATADPRSTWSTSAQDVVLTATGGNFDGTGVIRVLVAYLGDKAPTS